MTRVFSVYPSSVDGYMTGPDRNLACALGVGGKQLFDWYTDGDTQVQGYSTFQLSAPSAMAFEALVDRVGAAAPDDFVVGISPGNDSPPFAEAAAWRMPEFAPDAIMLDHVRGVLRDGPVPAR